MTASGSYEAVRNPKRIAYARSRWHAVWVIVAESFRHPLTATEIRIGEPPAQVQWHCKGVCTESWVGPADSRDPDWYESIGCKCPVGSEPDFVWNEL